MPYPPAEDSYLTLEALEDISGDVCIDVGTGSCILAEKLSRRCKHTVAIDLDPEACKSCPKDIDVVCGDGADALRKGDVVVSNLPYLPPDEIDDIAVNDLGLTISVLRWVSAHRPKVVVLTTSTLGRLDLITETLRAICAIVKVVKLHILFESIYSIVALC